MEHIIFLCHRIPYPPNKGDKIRSFNLLKSLAEHYNVHLGCFVDDPDDWQYQDRLAPFCASVRCIPLHPKMAYLRGSSAFLKGLPITVPFYGSAALQKWTLNTVAKHRIGRGLAFSSSMAQYLDHPDLPPMRRVIDFVDVDSNKWAQYARKKTGVMRWIYHREHQRLSEYENRITATFDKALLVSEDETALFQQQLPPALRPRVTSLSNGVDTDFFDPLAGFASDLTDDNPFVTFTGAMDYWANVDAVHWFCDQVWPRLRQQNPRLRFIIVGGNPAKSVLQLERLEGVTVTGRVPDVRPYLQEAALVVAPLRIARGIQNKVLEAMAMARPIVATSMAMEGIRQESGLCLKVADEAEPFIAACQAYLTGDEGAQGAVNREHVIRHYGWQQVLSDLPAQIEGGP